MLRDYNSCIYFAERESHNCTDIVCIDLKDGIGFENRNIIYSLDGCQIIALEKDASNI